MPFFYRALVALFTMIDPIGLVPVVLALTAGFPAASRAVIITRATVIAAGVIAVFAVFGQAIFNSLGVSPEAFSIAGGALLFLVAIDMLFGRPSGARETPQEAEEARSRDDISVFPLAIPMIAGPGTLTTTILLVETSGQEPVKWLAIAIAAVITLAVAWIAMLLSTGIQKRIGNTGILVVSRVLGLLLAAVAAQFILNGLTTYIAHLPGH